MTRLLSYLGKVELFVGVGMLPKIIFKLKILPLAQKKGSWELQFEIRIFWLFQAVGPCWCLSGDLVRINKVLKGVDKDARSQGPKILSKYANWSDLMGRNDLDATFISC